MVAILSVFSRDELPSGTIWVRESEQTGMTIGDVGTKKSLTADIRTKPSAKANRRRGVSLRASRRDKSSSHTDQKKSKRIKSGINFRNSETSVEKIKFYVLNLLVRMVQQKDSMIPSFTPDTQTVLNASMAAATTILNPLLRPLLAPLHGFTASS